jgi:hypothetical protein
MKSPQPPFIKGGNLKEDVSEADGCLLIAIFQGSSYGFDIM